MDLIDGTPVLDLKPYVPYADSIPTASSGWLDDGLRDHRRGEPAREPDASAGAPEDPSRPYRVVFAPQAEAQAAWLIAHGINLRSRAQETLSLGPAPHPYRRIRRTKDGWQLAIKEWRLVFHVEAMDIHVTRIHSGYRASDLGKNDPELEVHRDFERAFENLPKTS